METVALDTTASDYPGNRGIYFFTHGGNIIHRYLLDVAAFSPTALRLITLPSILFTFPAKHEERPAELPAQKPYYKFSICS